MDIYQREPVIEHLQRVGERLRTGLNEVIRGHGLERQIAIMGDNSNLLFSSLDGEGKPSQAFRTLLLQETIKRGVIMPSLVVSYSHQDADIDETINAIDGALAVYVCALNDGVDKFLVGRPSPPVYRTWNEKR
jgi:glutamate-1-semialdehyde 2,1-aminomutase